MTSAQQLLAQHRITMSRLDDAVRRILRVKFRAGLFDHPYVDQAKATDPASFVTPADRTAARDGGRQVDGAAARTTTPRCRSTRAKKTAVIGPLGDDQHDMLGPWWGRGEDEDAVSVLDGIKAAVARRDVRRRAARSSNNEPPDDDPDDDCASDDGFADAVATANAADQVVLALGETREMSGEAASAPRSTCPVEQQELIDAIKATGKPFVVVLFNGRPLTLGDVVGDLAGDPRGVVPGHRGRQRGRRRRLRQGQPGRQAAGLVPAAARPGADLLQPRADRPPVRRDPEVRLALPRPAHVRPALPVRLRAQLHDVRRHGPHARPATTMGRRGKRPRDGDGDQHR